MSVRDCMENPSPDHSLHRRNHLKASLVHACTVMVQECNQIMIPFWLQDIHARLTPSCCGRDESSSLERIGGSWNLRQSNPARYGGGSVFF